MITRVPTSPVCENHKLQKATWLFVFILALPNGNSAIPKLGIRVEEIDLRLAEREGFTSWARPLDGHVFVAWVIPPSVSLHIVKYSGDFMTICNCCHCSHQIFIQLDLHWRKTSRPITSKSDHRLIKFTIFVSDLFPFISKILRSHCWDGALPTVNTQEKWPISNGMGNDTIFVQWIPWILPVVNRSTQSVNFRFQRTVMGAKIKRCELWASPHQLCSRISPVKSLKAFLRFSNRRDLSSI
jgi:hypothetical protein